MHYNAVIIIYVCWSICVPCWSWWYCKMTRTVSPLTKGESAEQSRRRALMRSLWRQQDQARRHCKKRQLSENCFKWLLYVVVFCKLIHLDIAVCIIMDSDVFLPSCCVTFWGKIRRNDATIWFGRTKYWWSSNHCVYLWIHIVYVFDILLVYCLYCPLAQGWRHDRCGACAEWKLAVSRQAEFDQARAWADGRSVLKCCEEMGSYISYPSNLEYICISFNQPVHCLLWLQCLVFGSPILRTLENMTWIHECHDSFLLFDHARSEEAGFVDSWNPALCVCQSACEVYHRKSDVNPSQIRIKGAEGEKTVDASGDMQTVHLRRLQSIHIHIQSHTHIQDHCCSAERLTQT